MQVVYESPIMNREGERMDVHPALADRRVDESRDGETGYFAVDEDTARELELVPRVLMTAEEAEASHLLHKDPHARTARDALARMNKMAETSS